MRTTRLALIVLAGLLAGCAATWPPECPTDQPITQCAAAPWWWTLGAGSDGPVVCMPVAGVMTCL